MKNTILILLVFTSLTISSYSADLYRVYLKDKGNQTLEFGNQLYKDILTNLDKKAIERRKINLKTDNILSEKDIPIYEKYLDTLSELAIVKSKLKWYNYIIAEIDSSQLDIIQNLSFVNEVQSVLQHYSTDNNLVLLENCDRFEYNYSFNHLFMLNIPDLHRYGITGEGVRIGFLDSGFDYLQHKLNNPLQQSL